MKSTVCNIFLALKLISSKLPIGVEIINKPFSKFCILIIFIFIVSCTPVNNTTTEKVLIKNYPSNVKKSVPVEIKKQVKIKKTQSNKLIDYKLSNEIDIILPKFNNEIITNNLINSFELSIYKKSLNNITLKIKRYEDLQDLERILKLRAKPGKIFVGTLSSNATKLVKKYCKEKIIFFSLAADKSLANECIYLINFFPEDDLRALFNFFPAESKIALLYPENYYGYNINKIIDPIAMKSNSIIINRASYKEDLTNARDAIKELGKYELRKYELERQKKLLFNKNDEISKKVLKKIKKYQTLGNVEFTHLILPDYGIRLLEIAPLLPFYDVDPNKVKFVGTGVWDDPVFFEEPSLQGAIFSGIAVENREDFFNDYEYVYKDRPMRVITIPYDLVGILSHIINKDMSLNSAFELLDDGNIKFDGIDGRFFFKNNIIFRELDILGIEKGKAKKLN